MFYNYSVDIYNKTAGEKVNGIFIPGVLTYVKTVDVDIQPYSQTLLLKDYGYDIECNKRIFMDMDSSIKIGTVFYYVNFQGVTEKYETKALINWDYLEVIALEL